MNIGGSEPNYHLQSVRQLATAKLITRVMHSKAVPRPAPPELLSRLRSFLVDDWGMSPDLAQVYVESLGKGYATSTTVRTAHSGWSIRRAITTLDLLCELGLMRRSPERGKPGNPGGRGRGKAYSPVPPDEVIRPSLARASDLLPALGQIGEFLENPPPLPPEAKSDVWVTEHKQILSTFEGEVG